MRNPRWLNIDALTEIDLLRLVGSIITGKGGCPGLDYSKSASSMREKLLEISINKAVNEYHAIEPHPVKIEDIKIGG